MNRYLDIRSYFERLTFVFRALESRNFRMFFYANLFSQLGTWMQNLAVGWLIYRLTDSAVYLGLTGFMGQIPALILTPVAGVYADRLNRRKVLIITQTIPMLLAFLLAALLYTDTISVHLILGIVLINGFALAFDTPFRHAFLLEMVGDKKLIPNAVALNSTLVNTARFIGPTLGGLLVALYGEGVCFLINGISFMGVVGALVMMRVQPIVTQYRHRSVMHDLIEGFNYTWKFTPARHMILLVITTSMFGLPFQGFLPIFARDVLHGSSQLLGFLTGAVGAGALTGAFYLASRQNMFSLPGIIGFSALTFAIGLSIFSQSEITWFSLMILYFSGFGMITQFVATNTLLQTLVEEDKKGRVLSFYSMSFMGFTPLGSLMLGAVAEMAGVQTTFLITGLILFVAALLYRRQLNDIKHKLFGTTP
ncbi:MAG TPA: MFS transporter [Bacteroidales bacterium]|mgnify:CR=1 FL=1|nr:MFS transporter [Bacteroidales bacterium]